MKNLYLAIILLLIGITSSAQNNTFPTDNATWTNRYQSYHPPSGGGWITITSESYTKYCVYGTDTTINAISYSEIFSCDLIGSNYFGAFREDAGQVFFVPADSASEFLLYDFTLNAGDFQDVIIKDNWDNSFLIASTQISSVDTITVNNTQRRILYTNDGHSWTEGIGSSSGLFKGNPTNVSNYFIDLICISADDTIIFDFDNGNDGHLEQGIPGECDLALTIQEPEKEADFSIYPSPTNGQINIEIKDDNQIETIRLINNIGQVISTEANLKNNTIQFEINGPTGIYFVELITENGSKITKKVVKH